MNNTTKDVVKIIKFGDICAIYRISEEGHVSFSIIPDVDSESIYIKGKADPLVQISCTGDASVSGFAAGQTRHDSAFTMSMKYVSMSEKTDGDIKTVTTLLENSEGIRVEHIVKGQKNNRTLCVNSKVINNSEDDITIEKLSSFNLSGITPYTDDNANGRLVLHRFRSRWSAEGRHEKNTIEDLMLEPSWAKFGIRCEKFGTVGSMPIRGYFPFVAVEDTGAGVTWAISNACSSSWQIEAVRIDENLVLSGGLADYEFGHWRKILKKGEEFSSPKSYITVARCDFETVCDRLLDAQKAERLPLQKSVGLSTNKDPQLPAFFNEYCTTWGEPSEKKIEEMLTVINGKDFDYFVIDAGWYADSVKGWQDNMGDWIVAEDLFPNGLKPVVEKIKKAGMKAGIWFELEVVGKDSDALQEEAHLLTRDGKIIVSGTRRFWDMRSEWVEKYLTMKVIDFLNDNGFEYIKIDYNDTIGIGCDGSDSYGEGLRECIEGTKNFYRKIRENVPGITIEVCSSGGHRLEHEFMALADYLSFSDAHEEKEIPVIAADLHKLILPEKSQIWAVLRKEDELKRIAYSVCAGMYGALCISGDVFELSDEQWALAREGVEFYKKVSPVIINGITKRYGPFQTSNRALKDYQASIRYSEDKALVIVHSFEHEGIQKITIPINGKYSVTEQYEASDHHISVHKINLEENVITLEFEQSFDAVAVLMSCNEKTG